MMHSLSPTRTEGPVDYVRLAQYLSALAYPVRLALLDALRAPQALADIRVGVQRVEPGSNPGRPAAKQTVSAHLQKLVETGVVQVRPGVREGRSVPTFVVNPQRLYAVTEELRRLLVEYAGQGIGDDLTGTVVHGRFEAGATSGARLVLVHGVYDGKIFPLDERTGRDGRWVIGRSRGAAIALDYDPFVSVENSEIRHEQGRFVLHDVPESKNGTTLNWRPLTRGGMATLRAGDILGVGRSRLVFWDDTSNL